MTRPQRYLSRIIIFLSAVVAVSGVLFVPLAAAFMANPVLNGLIVGVFFTGIGFIIRQVLMLKPEVEWINTYRRSDPDITTPPPPNLLSPLASMIGETQGRLSLSTVSLRTILDGIAGRLDESRDISRYLISLLIFLGLLGTFWGLLNTIGSIGDTIRNLSIGSSDIAIVFDDLKRGLEAPLSGMGTAFSSSLFGLSGSVMLGFLDLQAGQAQTKFFNELEEWLATMTRISSGGGIGDGEQSVPVYIQALLEQTADSLDNLQRTLSRSEDSRETLSTGLGALADKLAALTDHMQAQHGLMLKLSDTQQDLPPLFMRLDTALESFAKAAAEPALDQASRDHLRSLDVHLGRIADDLSEGRQQFIDDFRGEIKLLARTLGTALSQNKTKA